MQPTLQFERHECKYLLDESQAQALHRRLSPYLELDPYGARSRDRRYPICSLYLDSPNYLLYRETQGGLSRRFKLRIRSYSDDPAVPLFLEIKQREEALVHKLRARLERAQLAPLLRGESLDLAGVSSKEQRTVALFESHLLALAAVPVAQVGYRREAYMGIGDPQARVTYDREIMASESPKGELGLPRPHWNEVELRRVVVELKFNFRCPEWMADAVRQLELRRTSYSKYSNAVDACLPGLRYSIVGRGR